MEEIPGKIPASVRRGNVRWNGSKLGSGTCQAKAASAQAASTGVASVVTEEMGERRQNLRQHFRFSGSGGIYRWLCATM